ncbi:MAG: GDCCVxC domain-containing (seleno)protein [Gemmatimonadales bacterium]
MTVHIDRDLPAVRSSACQKLLRPKPGDCCVFCSYGSVECPPRQFDAQRGG